MAIAKVVLFSNGFTETIVEDDWIEDDFEGWNNSSILMVTDDDDSTFYAHGIFGEEFTNLEKEYTGLVAGAHLQLSLRYYSVASWDEEKATIKINDE